MTDVIAIIPCRNEERTIGSVVLLTKPLVNKVIVVNNASNDNTAYIASAAGANIVYCEDKGMGIATKQGVGQVNFSKHSCIVTIDGDAQHNPEELQKLVAPILKREADLVIGSRLINNHSQMPIYRKIGIKIITWAYNLGHKNKITDGQCCFRAYKSDIFKEIEIEEDGFGFSIEILIKARQKGFRIAEVPVSCIYHTEFNFNSCMNPIKQGIIVIFNILKWRLKLRN